MAFEQGDIIDGKYRVVRMVGEGGMGHVYEGVNTRIGRRVAIKVLTADIAASEEMRKRFEREAQVAAKIGSPHICDVLDLGDLPSGEAYLVMEYLEGQTLDSLFEQRDRTSAEELAGLTFQLLDGLAAMHDAGIIHRDMKPANVFVCRSLAKTGPRDVVKLLDFGVSKFQASEGHAHVTQTGAVMGTPLYMSPEQARGERDIDGRSDIYSVGVIMYRGLTGRLPFEGENFPQLLFKIALEQAPPVRDIVPEVDEMFASIIERAMAKTPGERFETARAFQSELAAWARTHGQSSLAMQRTVRSNPPGPAADSVRSMPSLKSPKTPRGLDEKSTPTAWGKDKAPSASDLPAATDATIADVRPATQSAAAKTPAPSNPELAKAVEGAPTSQAATSQAPIIKEAPAAKKSPLLFVAVGAVLVGMAAAAVVYSKQPKVASEPPPAVDTAAPKKTADTVAPTATATASATATTVATAEPTSTATATAVTPTATGAVHVRTLPTATGAATAAPSATTAATTTATATAPAASASGKSGRKIRTEL